MPLRPTLAFRPRATARAFHLGRCAPAAAAARAGAGVGAGAGAGVGARAGAPEQFRHHHHQPVVRSRLFSSSASSSSSSTTTTTTAPMAEAEAAAVPTITAESLAATLRARLHTTHVAVEDLSGGCGQAFAAVIVSPEFARLTHLQRHRLVNGALRAEIAAIHAWTPRCLTPEQWAKEQANAGA